MSQFVQAALNLSLGESFCAALYLKAAGVLELVTGSVASGHQTGLGGPSQHPCQCHWNKPRNQLTLELETDLHEV